MAATTDHDLTGLGELHSLIGEHAEFEGTLTFEGKARIDGRFRGRVVASGVLVLGPECEVEGELDLVALIMVGGVLRGHVRASESVEIREPSRVYADITSPQLAIDKGAQIDGQCRVAAANESLQTPTAKEAEQV